MNCYKFSVSATNVLFSPLNLHMLELVDAWRSQLGSNIGHAPGFMFSVVAPCLGVW